MTCDTDHKEKVFPSMGSSMGLQMGPLIKWLGTLITRKSFLTNIGYSVDLQIPHKTWNTDHKKKFSLQNVFLFVFSKNRFQLT